MVNAPNKSKSKNVNGIELYPGHVPWYTQVFPGQGLHVIVSCWRDIDHSQLRCT